MIKENAWSPEFHGTRGTCSNDISFHRQMLRYSLQWDYVIISTAWLMRKWMCKISVAMNNEIMWREIFLFHSCNETIVIQNSSCWIPFRCNELMTVILMDKVVINSPICSLTITQNWIMKFRAIIHTMTTEFNICWN